MGWNLVGQYMGRKLVGQWMGRKPVGRWVAWKLGIWMRFAVRSGPESRLTVVDNTLIVAGNTRIGSGNIMTGPWDSLANSEYFERGMRRGQQRTNQPIGIRVNESKSLHEKGCYTHTKTPTESISSAQLENRASSWVFDTFP